MVSSTFHRERRGIHNKPGCSDRAGHLYQNTTTKAWCCFKCGAKGRGELTDVRWLGEQEIDPEKPLDHEGDGWYDKLSMHPLRAADKNDPMQRAWDYLDDHHIDPTLAVKFRFGVEGNKLVLPVFGPHTGQLVLYQTRTLFGKKAYKTTGNRSLIYPVFHIERNHIPGMVIVVESIVNAVRLLPWADTIPLCGKKASMYQIDRLKSESRHVLIWLDGGELPHAIDLMKAIWNRSHGRTGVVARDVATPSRDPCDYGDVEIDRTINSHWEAMQ